MQNVATPRFYVDLGQYLMAIGYKLEYAEQELTPDQIHLMSLTPSKQIISTFESGIRHYPMIPRVSPIKYCAFLGHSVTETYRYFYPVWYDHTIGGDNNSQLQTTNTMTINPAPFSSLPNDTAPEKGWSLWTFEDEPEKNWLFGVFSPINKIGAISIGDYYDMPNSPDLSLTMSYEMDGIKEITTKGGASLSNMTYYKPADWGDVGAWQIGDDEDGNPLSNIRAGRRVWNLSFSYVADSDLMPKVAATSNIDAFTNDYNVDGYPSENTLLEGSDFFSMVWNRTLGGHLKFIFNPAGGGTSPNNNPDQFAICKFDMNSLQYKQVAHKVYDVKLKIREVW